MNRIQKYRQNLLHSKKIAENINTVLVGIFQFVSFELLTLHAWNYLPSSFTTDHKPITHFACGGVTGIIASFASQPFDVIRTRLIAQGEPKV